MPRWADDPTHILGVIANYLRLENRESAPPVLFAKGATAAKSMTLGTRRRRNSVSYDSRRRATMFRKSFPSSAARASLRWNSAGSPHCRARRERFGRLPRVGGQDNGHCASHPRPGRRKTRTRRNPGGALDRSRLDSIIPYGRRPGDGDGWREFTRRCRRPGVWHPGSSWRCGCHSAHHDGTEGHG